MKLKDYLNSGDRFASKNGISLVEVSRESAKATMVVTEQHSNAGGVCQGGAIFTLADLVFAALVNAGGQLSFAINSTIYYHQSANIGDRLTAEGCLLYSHPKIPAAKVVVTNQNGVHVATFTAQGYSKRGRIEVEL